MDNSFQYTKKHFLNKEDVLRIKALEQVCMDFEDITLKLELEYKLADALAKKYIAESDSSNEFFCYQDSKLIGYLGICKFGNSPLELNGMVDPNYRNLGVFQHLYQVALKEIQNRKEDIALFLTDSKSKAGIECIKQTGAKLSRIEYEMVYTFDETASQLPKGNRLVLEKATNQDALEIHHQNKIFEQNPILENEGEEIEVQTLLPEEEELRGVVVYLIKQDGVPVGKIHLHCIGEVGWIYGFFIYPQHRGQGLGKESLQAALTILHDARMKEAILQVDSINNTAFNLYRSIGFVEASAMEYYQLNLKQ